MENSFYKPLLVFTFFALVFSSCKKKSDEPSNTAGSTNQTGTMTCKINGVNWSAKSFNNTLLKDVGAKRIDIRGIDANGNQLILTIVDNTLSVSGNGIKLDNYYMDLEENFNGTTYPKSAIGTFYKSNTNYFSTIISDGPNDRITVTSCDGNARTISGTFQFESYNGFKDSTIVITEGAFETEY